MTSGRLYSNHRYLEVWKLDAKLHQEGGPCQVRRAFAGVSDSAKALGQSCHVVVEAAEMSEPSMPHLMQAMQHVQVVLIDARGVLGVSVQLVDVDSALAHEEKFVVEGEAY